MIKTQNKYGDWALVAGAAKGLGEAFCVTLANQGIHIIMVDNQQEALFELSETLKERYSIETIPLLIDLSKDDSFDQIMNNLKNLDCRLLIYNAAYSRIKKITQHRTEDLNQYLSINIGTQLKLVHAFSNRLIDKKQSGGILLMSSLAGLLGMQLIAPYAASKAFAWNLAEALNHELKSNQIDVTACIAGATATEAYLTTKPKAAFFKPQVQQPEEVAKSALKNLGKKALYISGLGNRINYFILTRLMPRKLAARMANRTMRKMYPEA